MKNYGCWDCKIGPHTKDLPDGADLPMREAVKEAYRKLTGKEPEWLFSGWGSKLDEIEIAVVENREPRLRQALADTEDK